ncbi:UDP-3-O-acyl-N-acetylglucosamine deacetylase [Azospirillum sp. SYSU D00513]|uniref:UDP-3-O-acyl-N-acetylglucosamine deacetylase n=1 Tax=Azospirillum sp. SYSU D00513 TaxID=2812561 RepID=UPI0032B54F62
MLHKASHADVMFQRTLRKAAGCSGVGLHSGNPVTMTVAPAEANSGISFIRTDRPRAGRIPARWDRVVDTRLCTVLAGDEGTTVGTVEHLMAALAGCGIDNAVIMLDGPEVPIMDGSSQGFVELIERAGTVAQAAPRRAIRVLKPVTVTEGAKSVSLFPDEVTSYGVEIDFDSAAIARQARTLVLDGSAFRDEVSRARTFGFLHEVEAMRKAGLARGGSLDNAIVISGDTVMNEGGLRYGDEFVRHKILDAVGDLYLAGAPLIGRFHGVRPGHAMNNRLLHALFAQADAWCYETIAAPVERAVA